MPHDVIQPRRLHAILSKIQARIYDPLQSLHVNAWVTPEPVPFAARTSGKPVNDIQPGDVWGAELWDCAWFHFEGRVPDVAKGHSVVLLIDVNGELCLVDSEGTPRQGLTNVNSEFDKSLGLPGKRVVPIADNATGQEVIDLWGDAGCNDLFGRYRGGTLREAQIAICHEQTKQLFYDFEVLLELAEQLPAESARRQRLFQKLYDASNHLPRWSAGSVQRARAVLAPELAKRGGDPTLRVSAVGHAHIDLAWLWPLRETIRKGARTFATALRMMERYPDYVFGASQPQLYLWIKDHHPKLYAEVKQRVAQGRWEVQGAMWVEPDSNVTGGESLVRQILHGKRFFQREFGLDMKILWVPDIFGYTASLPQILKKSGVDYMMTQKLSWNRHNTHPHSSFLWEGIDGSQVLTHMPPEDTYNSPAAPRSIVKAEANYRDKNVSEQCLLVFGIGDGGGGPGEEHLERLAREKDLQGLAPVKQEPAIVFFEKLAREADRFKIWRGELYLEMHQGTLTTQARNKRYNRKMEKALRELEFAATLHTVLVEDVYPSAVLETVWQEVLLYQFHDILPGSSITRVYTESLARYADMLARTEQLTRDLYDGIARSLNAPGNHPAQVFFNSLPWERQEWVRIDERWVQVSVPAMGYCVVDRSSFAESSEDAVFVSENRIENQYLRVSLNADGAIYSIYDKEHQREVVAADGQANQFSVYADHGDAWDFDEGYANTLASPLQRVSLQANQEGPNAVIEQVYRYQQSTVRQRMVLRAGSRQIDFETRLDWREGATMLRTAFPLNVQSDHVNCEMQFGYVQRPTHRNTSWDYARNEICAHQWIDLSEPDYGVAILNDAKYGHRALANVLDINLLRTPSYPDPDADRAVHEFTYSLYPHHGDFVAADVYRRGYELNVPLQPGFATALATNLVTADGEPSTRRFSLVRADSTRVMVEAVKKAEEDDSTIIRLYETSGSYVRTTLSFGLPIRSVQFTNLLEIPLDVDVEWVGEEAAVAFAPFEIITLKVHWK